MPIKKVTPVNQPMTKAQKDAKHKADKAVESGRKDIIFGDNK